jgi:hypothetical protein
VNSSQRAEAIRADLALILEDSNGDPYRRLAVSIPELLAENERLRRQAKADSDGLNRWCNYQDRLFAVMSADEIRAFDARLTEGGWTNEPLCRHESPSGASD